MEFLRIAPPDLPKREEKHSLISRDGRGIKELRMNN